MLNRENVRAVLVDQSGSAIKYTCPQLTQRKHSHWLTATAKRTNIRALLNLLQLQTFGVMIYLAGLFCILLSAVYLLLFSLVPLQNTLKTVWVEINFLYINKQDSAEICDEWLNHYDCSEFI